MKTHLTQILLLGTICFWMTATFAIGAETAGRGTMGSAGDAIEAQQDAEEAIGKAAGLIDEMASAAGNDQKIPADVLQNAQAVAIVPDVLKAAVVAGGRYGQGVLLTRNQDNWSHPVLVTLGGASIGAQIGVESSDLIMVFNKQQAVQNLIKDSDFTLGVDASVAAGSMGAKAKGMATEADVVTYQRIKGLFAGVSLTGGVLDVDEEATQAYYQMDQDKARGYRGDEGRKDEAQVTQRILDADLEDESIKAPASAKSLQEALKQYASGKK